MLLSESELRSALEPLLDRLLVERLRLFQLQLEPRLQAMIEAAVGPAARAQAETGARLAAIVGASDPEAIFERLWEASAEAGPARALLVSFRGQMAVWRAEGLELPAAFAESERERHLARGASLAVTVRGLKVGELYWERARKLEDTKLAELALHTRAAGIALLGQALAMPREAAQTAGTESQPESARAPRPAPTGADPASRFAALLIEDLELYLRRERGNELEAARARGNAGTAFGGEIERCRRAFRERYPDAGAIFEEAAQRLGT